MGKKQQQSLVVKQQQAYQSFLECRGSLKSIAASLGMELTPFLSHASQENWFKDQQLYAKALTTWAQSVYKRFIAEHRQQTLVSHLALVSKLQDKISQKLDKIDVNHRNSVVELELITKAFKNISDISTKLVALSDKPFEAEELAAAQKPLFIINTQPQLPVSTGSYEERPAIDVTPRKDHPVLPEKGVDYDE